MGRAQPHLSKRDRSSGRSAEPGQSIVQTGPAAGQAARHQFSRAQTHNRVTLDFERLRPEHGVLYRWPRLGRVHGGNLRPRDARVGQSWHREDGRVVEERPRPRAATAARGRPAIRKGGAMATPMATPCLNDTMATPQTNENHRILVRWLVVPSG